jgi:type II secretory pathway pseudopilin PulG
MMAGARLSRRVGPGAFTLVEILLTLAVMALLGSLLLPGVNSIMGSMAEREPAQVIWTTLSQVREQALLGNRPLRLTFSEDKTQLIWTDGQQRWTKELPQSCHAQLLPAYAGNQVLIGGQAIETKIISGVYFYADGACDAFRVQLRPEAGPPQILSVDPWTAAPIIKTSNALGEN